MAIEGICENTPVYTCAHTRRHTWVQLPDSTHVCVCVCACVCARRGSQHAEGRHCSAIHTGATYPTLPRSILNFFVSQLSHHSKHSAHPHLKLVRQ